MAEPICSKRRAKAIFLGCFLLALALVAYFKAWWPGIMLAVGLPLAFRQFLLGRRYDMAVTLFVCIGVFITVQFDISWEVLLPVLFTLGAIYIFFREYLESKETSEDEDEEDKNVEIKESQHKK